MRQRDCEKQIESYEREKAEAEQTQHTHTIGQVIKSYKSIKASVSYLFISSCVRSEIIRQPLAFVSSTEIQFKAPDDMVSVAPATSHCPDTSDSRNAK